MSGLKGWQKAWRRQVLLEQHGNACWWCGEEMSSDDMTLDHLVPRSRGGSNRIANLCLAHARCNALKGNRLFLGEELPA